MGQKVGYWKLHGGSLTSNKTWGVGNLSQKNKNLSDITLGNLYNIHHPMQTNTIVDSTFHF
jgi:hypothetical protein